VRIMEAVVMVMVMVILGALSPVEGVSLKSLYFLQTPTDMTVSSGDEIVLECEAGPRERVTDCQWTREGVGLGDMNHLPRHSMNGCNLVISPVQLEDEGEYICQAGGVGVHPIASPSARIEVQVEPGRPFIHEAREGDWVEVEQGQELILTCESQGGLPHAELQWKDGEGQVIMGNAVEHVTKMGDFSSFKTVSQLRFNPLEAMKVICTAHSEAFPEIRRTRELSVQLRKEVEEELMTVRTGDNIQITCGQESGLYKWLLNDRKVEGETGSTLNIEDFTPDFDNSVVKCLQEKFGGESRLLKLVRLKYDDTRSIRNRRMNMEEREISQADQAITPSSTKKKVFTCVAEVDNDEDPPYVWVNGRLEKITPASDNEGKKYKCKIVTGGMKKVGKMEKKLKNMSKELRRYSKMIRSFARPNEES